MLVLDCIVCCYLLILNVVVGCYIGVDDVDLIWLYLLNSVDLIACVFINDYWFVWLIFLGLGGLWCLRAFVGFVCYSYLLGVSIAAFVRCICLCCCVMDCVWYLVGFVYYCWWLFCVGCDELSHINMFEFVCGSFVCLVICWVWLLWFILIAVCYCGVGCCY